MSQLVYLKRDTSQNISLSRLKLPVLISTSIIFPVYNYLGLQIRGGAFHQDDACSLELDLAERFYYEAQVQVSFDLSVILIH